MILNNIKKQTLRIEGLKAIAGIVLTGSALLGSGNALATTYTFGSFLTNSDFEAGAAGTTIPGWTSTGGSNAVNVRPTTDLINITTGNAGFSKSTTGNTGTGFFDSKFAVLGDAARTILGTSAAEPTSGTFTLYQDFTLATTYNNEKAIDYTLNFDFLSVFDGRDSLGFSGTDNVNDFFFATLINLGNTSEVAITSKDSNGLSQTCLGNGTVCPDTALHQIDTSTNTAISGLLPGNYRLEFKLREISTGTGTGANSASATTTNTAVGIDNVVVQGSVNTSVPEPGALVLMTLGLLGFRMRKSA
jgi:hypothetical protein